jgi:hypothetical protein
MLHHRDGGIMKTMYKEEVVRKKLPVILGMFLLLTATIFVADLIARIEVGETSVAIVTSPVLMIFMGAMVMFSIIKCRERFRYSIIADQLIIHRIIKDEHVVVENIKLKDIEFIGRPCNLRSKLDVKAVKRYVCSTFRFKTYCCIYKEGSSLKKFYFQPSECFISKVLRMVEDEKLQVS